MPEVINLTNEFIRNFVDCFDFYDDTLPKNYQNVKKSCGKEKSLLGSVYRSNFLVVLS